MAGVEAATHSVCELFIHDDCDAVLLVDASNTFNSLNRIVALHNIWQFCPPFAPILINVYWSPASLFISGDVLLSEEGTTQGLWLWLLWLCSFMSWQLSLCCSVYPWVWYRCGMQMMRVQVGSYVCYGIGGIIHSFLYSDQHWRSASNMCCSLRITQPKLWTRTELTLNKLWELGPQFGYFVNAAKTWLVTKDHLLQELWLVSKLLVRIVPIWGLRLDLNVMWTALLLIRSRAGLKRLWSCFDLRRASPMQHFVPLFMICLVAGCLLLVPSFLMVLLFNLLRMWFACCSSQLWLINCLHFLLNGVALNVFIPTSGCAKQLGKKSIKNTGCMIVNTKSKRLSNGMGKHTRKTAVCKAKLQIISLTYTSSCSLLCSGPWTWQLLGMLLIDFLLCL